MSGPKKLSREPAPGIPARLRQLRLDQAVTQAAFAESVGLAPNTYSRYESGVKPLTDVAKCSICNIYHVNKIWLDTGEGDMYVSLDPDDTVAQYTADLLSGATTDFERGLITALAQLPKSYWPVLRKSVKISSWAAKKRTRPKPGPAYFYYGEIVKQSHLRF